MLLGDEIDSDAKREERGPFRNKIPPFLPPPSVAVSPPPFSVLRPSSKPPFFPDEYPIQPGMGGWYGRGRSGGMLPHPAIKKLIQRPIAISEIGPFPPLLQSTGGGERERRKENSKGEEFVHFRAYFRSCFLVERMG